MRKKALITGIGGQDGSYLAGVLNKKKIIQFLVYCQEDLVQNYKLLGLKKILPK